MSQLVSRLLRQTAVRSRRSTSVFLVAASAAILVGVSLLATGGDARSPKTQTAKAPVYVRACNQRTGPTESIGDLNIRLRIACAKGQKALKLALYPADGRAVPPALADLPVPRDPGATGSAGPARSRRRRRLAAEYAVANVLVSRGGARPVVWATFSTTFGSPVGTTAGGLVRFSCSAAQAPCKVSVAAAVLSQRTGAAHLFPRVLIQKEDGPRAPQTFCEYANGADNNGAVDHISPGRYGHPRNVNRHATNDGHRRNARLRLRPTIQPPPSSRSGCRTHQRAAPLSTTYGRHLRSYNHNQSGAQL